MKKVLIALLAVFAFSAIAEDQTFTIAVGETSISITNDSVDQRWYMKSVYALQSSGTNDTLSLKKVSGSSDVVIATAVNITTNTDYAITVPSTVYLSPSEVAKVTRVTDTNTTITGFVVTGGTD
jgi:hypothetical protein